MRSVGVAYLLWVFGGWMGAHRFYLGQPHVGLLYLFTYGLCGFGWLLDGLLIPGMVEQANAGVYAEHAKEAFFQRVKHDFRPHVRPTSGPNPLALILGFLLVIAMMCFMCFMATMLLGLHAIQEEKDMEEAKQLAHAHEAAREEAERPPASGARPAPAASLRAKHPELDRLHVTHHSVAAVIEKKIDPTLARLRKDEEHAKAELRRLRPQVKTSQVAAFKAKKYLEELKEIQAYVKRMQRERERYEQQAVELEMAMRKMERALEVSEVLDEDNKSDLKRLLARGEALVEEAAKGFDKRQGSLQAEVEAKTDAAPRSDVDPAVLEELDRLGIDGE